MSKRGNGLSASSYAPLADLTPRVADAMLTALRDAGIAAYAVPVTGRSPGLLGPRTPAEPTDRLFVDAKESELARNVLRSQLPRLLGGDDQSGRGDDDREPRPDDGKAGPDERDPREDDAIFAEIVARFDAPADDPGWPQQENLDDEPAATGRPREGDGASADGPDAGRDTDDDTAAPGGRRGTGGRRRDDADDGDASASGGPLLGRVVKPAGGRADGDHPRTGRRYGSAFGPDAPDDEDLAADQEPSDDHYVPPPPPPLPTLDPVTRGAWLALFGGPLYLLLAAMLGWDVAGWTAFAAVAAFVGGFVTLVIRMGDEPRGSDPDDDGAVV